MPFIVVRREGRYCVFTESGQGTGKPTGDSHGCHDTREEAMAQMRALYARVPEARPKKETGVLEVKHVTTPAEFKADGEEGSITAVFSTFDVVDRGGDVVGRKAFKDGQPVPLVWAHQWDKPIGKGVVHVLRDRAIFEGKFFLDTTWGLDAYRTVKAMGDLQEFSWGFKITDHAYGQKDGEEVRFINGADVFEVSPVLVGEGLGTRTLAIKRARTGADETEEKDLTAHGSVPGSYEDYAAQIAMQIGREYGGPGGGYAETCATFGDYAIVRLARYDSERGGAVAAYYRVPYSVTGDEATIGEASEVQLEFTQAKGFKVGRRISRATESHIRAALEALGALLEAETADAAEQDDDKSADPALPAAGERLADDLAGYVARLVAAPHEDLRKDRDALSGFSRRLSAWQGEVDRALDRAARAGDAGPRELRRQYEQLVAQLGPPR